MTLPAGRVPGPAGWDLGSSTGDWSEFGRDVFGPPPAFKNIARSDFETLLAERVADPIKINQKETSLCGPASLMFLTAQRAPSEYERFVKELYESGTSQLRGIKITPGTNCKNYDPGDHIPSADWVALASIRDSENLIWNYDEANDEFGGITLPMTLAGWLKDAEFKGIENETNLYVTKGESNFREAADLFRRGYHVCILVDWEIVDGCPLRGALSQTFTLPNHWVTITSITKVTPEDVQFEVFSWGKTHKVGGAGPLTMKNLFQNYYGYVACTF